MELESLKKVARMGILFSRARHCSSFSVVSRSEGWREGHCRRVEAL